MPAAKPTRHAMMSMHCPACGTAARIRNSRPASETVRDLYMECTNADCRCIFQAIAEATKIFAPSMLPIEDQTAASRGLRRGKNARPAPPPHDPRQLTLLAAAPPDT